MMPKKFNFNIDVKETTGKDIYIELAGNFDAASALELIFFMNKCFPNYEKVFINTDFLWSIESFGINFFRYNINSLVKHKKHFEFSGESAPVFTECWPKDIHNSHNGKARNNNLPFQGNSIIIQ